MAKQLMRSNENKVIAGVCGGLGEYFDVDPVFVRIVAVILAFANGFGLLGYIIAWIIMPKPEEGKTEINVSAAEPAVSAAKTVEKKQEYSSWNRYLPGLILVFIGALLLIRENWYWFDWDEFWPILLILVGLGLILRRGKKHEAKDPMDISVKTNNNTRSENGGSTV